MFPFIDVKGVKIDYTGLSNLSTRPIEAKYAYGNISKAYFGDKI